MMPAQHQVNAICHVMLFAAENPTIMNSSPHEQKDASTDKQNVYPNHKPKP